MRRLKDRKGWTGPDADEKAAEVMSDPRTIELDSKAAALIARIDELSEVPQGKKPDCGRLGELEATALELQATIRAKSLHVIAKLEREAAGTAANPVGPEASAAPPPATQSEQPQAAERRPSEAEKKVVEATPSTPAPIKPPTADAKPAPAPRKLADIEKPPASPSDKHASPAVTARPSTPTEPNSKSRTIGGWVTENVERTTSAPSLTPAVPPQTATGPVAMSVPPTSPPGDSFSSDEIREASRGFFGTISSGLATVMEHAFSTLGRPTAYVLGNEGGGAFIAGVRYGKGTLFLRDGTSREVYWHGPSIGYDIGAAGSKTMFLVYNLKRDLDIFTGYTGVDGSAYLVGGVGMTVLTDGKVVMAPIRSGLGVRLGASIGYIRFTARPTWNPF